MSPPMLKLSFRLQSPPAWLSYWCSYLSLHLSNLSFFQFSPPRRNFLKCKSDYKSRWCLFSTYYVPGSSTKQVLFPIHLTLAATLEMGITWQTETWRLRKMRQVLNQVNMAFSDNLELLVPEAILLDTSSKFHIIAILTILLWFPCAFWMEVRLI